MPYLVEWKEHGMCYAVEDRGRRFALTATGNVTRRYEDTIGDAGRAEWLTITDRERTDWAELLLAHQWPA